MPIYTYRCESCGVQFERQQSFSDQALAWCPECNKKSLRKVYTPVGIVFKGSGFYSTDHRSPSGTSRAGGKPEAAEKKESTENKESTEKKSETNSSTKED
jgi:putative FmdB family regulatory protein